MGWEAGEQLDLNDSNAMQILPIGGWGMGGGRCKLRTLIIAYLFLSISAIRIKWDLSECHMRHPLPSPPPLK